MRQAKNEKRNFDVDESESGSPDTSVLMLSVHCDDFYAFIKNTHNAHTQKFIKIYKIFNGK